MSNLHNKKCVILVPVGNRVEPEVDTALRILESRGYEVWRTYGISAIDQGRCQMIYHALFSREFEEFFWIDSDVAFNPDDVDKIRAHNLPITCGIYSMKGWPQMTGHFKKCEPIKFGKEGGLVEMQFAATGFLHIRRHVFDKILDHLNLPLCNAAFSHPIYPFFMPMIIDTPSGEKFYMGEDYSFCERARRCGFKIFADTTVKLKHWGHYPYQWDEVVNGLPQRKDEALITPHSNQWFYGANSSHDGHPNSSHHHGHHNHKCAHCKKHNCNHMGLIKKLLKLRLW